MTITKKSARAKGKLLENQVAEQIRDSGVDKTAKREKSSGSGNRDKSDIINSIGYNMECKNQKKFSLKGALDQTIREAERTHTTPSVVFKRPFESNKWIIIPFYEWIRLYKASKEPKLREDSLTKYNLTMLIQYAKKILKELQ